MSSDIVINEKVLTQKGKEFIEYVCRGDGDYLISGNNGLLPYSVGVDKDKVWTANIKDNNGNLITKNSELAPLLIKWFEKYSKIYSLDPNVLAAQAYIESNYKMWNYSEYSTASGINQFICLTTYGVIVDNFSTITPKMSTAEISAITNTLVNSNEKVSYKMTNNNPEITKIARENHVKLHQNIIDNPEIMIKAQARYMSYISSRCDKLASTSLFCYSRGIGFVNKTYSGAINEVKRRKNNKYLSEGLDYVLKIFGVLGEEINNTYLAIDKGYKPNKYWFGYNLGLGDTFDAFTANIYETSSDDVLIYDNLTISENSKYKYIGFPENQYKTENTKKNQIVIHHTVSGGAANGSGIKGDIAYWMSNGEDVATAFLLSRDGGIYQLFNTNYWAYHIGTKINNYKLNSQSIGIEIDSWGGLIKYNGKWYPAKMDGEGNNQKLVANTKAKPLSDDMVVKYDSSTGYPKGFRGFYGFEKYTDNQIIELRNLLLSLHEKFPSITLKYNTDMWDLNNKNTGCLGISQNALDGNSGIWTHTSYRKTKSDCHPQPDLVSMLMGLSELTNYDISYEKFTTSIFDYKKHL